MKLRRLGPAAVAAAAALTLFAQGGPVAPVATAAQSESANLCPMVMVSCPDSASEGDPVSFSAEVARGDPAVTPTFNWTVSASSIEAGQGTASISVGTAGLGGSTITATLDVGGYSRSCSTSNSCTVSVSKAARAVKFAEYVTKDLSANKAVLDRWVIALANDPSAQGYLIAYGGKTSRVGDAQKAADSATDYTINVRKMDGARTLSGVGGYRDKPTVELFIGPVGGTPPMGTPTVAAEKVKPRGG